MNLKKEINIFGKTVPAFVIGLLVLSTFASAAVFNYLSNTVTATGEIESPVKLSIRDGSPMGNDWTTWDTGKVPTTGWSGDDTISLNGHGGDTKTFWVMAENLADQSKTSNLVFDVYCNKGLSNSGPGPNNPEIDDFVATITVYDWNHDSGEATDKRVIVVPDAENDETYGIETKMVGNHLRVWYPSTWVFPNGDDGDTYYVEVELEYANGAQGTYTIKSAWLEDPTGSF